jgi:hypothetical protein
MGANSERPSVGDEVAMELIAIHLARLVAFLELEGFEPRGRASAPDGFKRITDRYSFSKSPQIVEEYNFEKGVNFLIGKLGDINIDKLTLFGDGISIDTRSSTDDCEVVLSDLLEGVKELRGVTIKPSRRMRVSNILFRSKLKLAAMHGALQLIADRIAASVSADYGQHVGFEPIGISLGADLSQLGLKPSPFTIERRANTPFSEGMYFSAAPLGTSEHLGLLQQFEESLGS